MPRPLPLAALVISIALATCSSPPSAGQTTSPAASPLRGGTAIVAWQEPATLDLLYAGGVQASATVARVAVEGLTKLGPDGKEIAVLASELPTVANGEVSVAGDGRSMSVRYRLREGVLWSDGTPLTSADVRFTWRTIMTDPKVAARDGYDRMTDVETPDDNTVIVRYSALDPAYLSRFDAILPRHLLDGATDATRASYGRAPLGTGPFTVTEFSPGDHITVQRNTHYRIAGEPYLDRVIFRFTPSLDVAKAQLIAGEADLAPSIFESDAADLERQSGIVIASSPSPLVEGIMFQLSGPVTKDLEIRRALLRATPKQRIVDTLLFGRARVGSSEVPLGWAAVDGLGQDAYDPARAMRDLDTAGWTVGGDGVRARGGVRASLSITGTTGNTLRERVEQVLVDEWKAIGVEVRITNVASTTLTASWSANGVRKRGAFDMVIANVGLGTAGADPLAYLAQRHSCASVPSVLNSGAGANYEHWCDASVDAALATAQGTLDREAQRTPLARVLRAVNDQVVGIWLYDRGRIDALRSRLRNIQSNGWDQVTWNVQDWWLAK